MIVRVRLRFKVRQKAHKEVGFEIVNRFVSATALHGRPDCPPKMLGERDLNVVLSPLPRSQRGKGPRVSEPRVDNRSTDSGAGSVAVDK